jgi:hypothetical protein
MRRTPSACSVIAATLFALSGPCLAQQPATNTGASANTAMQEMMKRMMPSTGHKVFTRMAGKWRGTLRIWNSATPDAPPMETATESESKLVLGGRFIVEEANSSVMRMPMQRMSVLGYDNMTNEYTLVFYSSMETATNTAVGTANDEGNVITLRGEFNEPGGKYPFKNVVRLESDDVHTFESYRILPDGRELKLIEQVMTRVK